MSRPPRRADRPPGRDDRRTAGARSGGAARHPAGTVRGLREEVGTGVVDRAGSLSHERLLGADPLRLPERDREGLRRRGGDRRWGGDHRPSRADLRPQSVRLRSQALPGAVGAEARCTGPGGPAAKLELARGVPAHSPAAREPHGQSRQEGVHPDPAAAGGLRGGDRGRQCRAGDAARRDQLRCGQAARAGPHRATPGPARSDPLSLSSYGRGENHGGGRLRRPAVAECGMSTAPQVLLAHHLKALKLPTFLREYEKVAGECAREGVDHLGYLLRLAELELIDRERRLVERRIREARFPAVKSLDTFDFTAMPSLNKLLVLELARCEFVVARDNIIVLGNSGTGKTHIALALGLAACQRGFSVAFATAAGLVHQLQEVRDERRLLRLQQNLVAAKLLIIDELGYVPLSQTGAELLFEVFSQRHERSSTIVTSNLPFEEWTSLFGSERLTGALLDRLTHHVHILEMNGDSYRLKHSKARRRRQLAQQSGLAVDPDTGEIHHA